MDSTCRTHLSLPCVAQVQLFASISLQPRVQVSKGVRLPKTRGAQGTGGSVALWPTWNQPAVLPLASQDLVSNPNLCPQ